MFCKHEMMQRKFIGLIRYSKACVKLENGFSECPLQEINSRPEFPPPAPVPYKPKRVVGRKIVEDPNYIDGRKRCPTCNRLLFEGTNTERLRNLLAVIHGDGGHYFIKHGLEQASKDAEIIVSYLKHEKRLPTKEELENGRNGW